MFSVFPGTYTMYSRRLKERSGRLAHLAVAVALSMALIGANAQQQIGAATALHTDVGTMRFYETL